MDIVGHFTAWSAEFMFTITKNYSFNVDISTPAFNNKD